MIFKSVVQPQNPGEGDIWLSPDGYADAWELHFHHDQGWHLPSDTAGEDDGGQTEQQQDDTQVSGGTPAAAEGVRDDGQDTGNTGSSGEEQDAGRVGQELTHDQ